MAQNRRMPDVNVIKRYWEGKFRFIEDFGWNELPINACWKCGKERYIEKCHIHAKCSGGDDSPSNLHLLCGWCHKRSELLYGFEPGLAYYEWFYSGGDEWWFPMLMNLWNVKEYEDIENKFLPEYKKMVNSGFKTGKTILFKEKHERFKKLSKQKGKDFTNYMITEGVF